MQIACKKFGCQKAVEVCYWTCKYRRNCKDWAGALAGQPGLTAITERLEAAAAKSGRVFEARTLVKPGRPKRAAAPVLIASSAKIETTVAPQLLRKKNNHQPLKAAPKTESKPMAKLPTEEEKTTAEITTQKPPVGKSGESKTPSKTARPKTPSDGTVYLLLSKNGKYKELRESDLIKEAATILKDSSLRLVKGQYLVPYITFKSPDE